MAGRTVSGYLDDIIAERLNALAQAEARSPANIVGQALAFYSALPEAARTSLRRFGATASPDEMRWFQTEFMRLLLKVDMEVTQRKMAKEMGANLPDASTEEEIEQASVEWTNGLAE